jgi:hypothetical protein
VIAARAGGAGIVAVGSDLGDPVGAPIDAVGLRVEDAERRLSGQLVGGVRYVGGLRWPVVRPLRAGGRSSAMRRDPPATRAARHPSPGDTGLAVSYRFMT